MYFGSPPAASTQFEFFLLSRFSDGYALDLGTRGSYLPQQARPHHHLLRRRLAGRACHQKTRHAAEPTSHANIPAPSTHSVAVGLTEYRTTHAKNRAPNGAEHPHPRGSDGGSGRSGRSMYSR